MSFALPGRPAIPRQSRTSGQPFEAMVRAQPMQFGAPPVAKVTPFEGPRATLEMMAAHVLGARGEQDMVVRSFTTFIVRQVAPKDYLGEILAVRNAFVQPSPWLPGVPLFRYLNDPRHVETVMDPRRLVDEIIAHGTTLCDCDDSAMMAATMLCQLGRNCQLVALGFKPDSLSHVGVRAQEPKSNRWIWMDGVAGPREAEAANKAVELMVLSLD